MAARFEPSYSIKPLLNGPTRNTTNLKCQTYLKQTKTLGGLKKEKETYNVRVVPNSPRSRLFAFRGIFQGPVSPVLQYRIRRIYFVIFYNIRLRQSFPTCIERAGDRLFQISVNLDSIKKSSPRASLRLHFFLYQVSTSLIVVEFLNTYY